MRERRIAVLTLVMTFLLLIVGGVVHTTGSSLACPDWPLCYGQVFPKMEGGILFEHSHRLIASAVASLTLILTVLLVRRRDDRSVAKLGLIGLALVLFQATLGGITVIYRLPAAVSTAHLATSMLFFSWLVFMIFRLGPHGKPAQQSSDELPRKGVFIAIVAVYLQIVLGAVVRHTGSAMACGTDLLQCGGMWPPESGPGWVHMTHRFMAFVAFTAVIAGTIPALRAAKASGRSLARLFAVVSHILIVIQIILGLVTVVSFVHLHVVTTHLAVGALLLADLVALYCAMGPMGAGAFDTAALLKNRSAS